MVSVSESEFWELQTGQQSELMKTLVQKPVHTILHSILHQF